MTRLSTLALASALLLSAAASAQNNPPPRPHDTPPNNPSPNNPPNIAPRGGPNNGPATTAPNNVAGPQGPGFAPVGNGGFGGGGPGGAGGPGPAPGGFNPGGGFGGPGGFGAPGGGRPGFGGPGNFGNNFVDTAAIKTLLQSSDEEWKVILPLLQNLISARQNLESAANSNQGRVGGGMPANDPFGGPADNASGPGFGGNRGGRGGRGFGFAPPDPAATNPATTNPAAIVSATRSADPALIPNLAATKPATPPKSSSLVQALADLQATVADKTSTEKQIKDRMALVRAARQKAHAAIQTAQNELRKVLTTDQEAALMGLGYLE